MAEEKHILLESDVVGRTIKRMAHEVIEKSSTVSDIVLIGIRSRGVHLARRIARRMRESFQIDVPLGVIDVTPYRDDRNEDPHSPTVGAFETPVTVDDKIVVLIDDVIFRGRTIRAAMEAVERLGQPKRILVAALIDRGARELPIRADIIGKNIEAGDSQRVNVLLEESDGVDQVTVANWPGRHRS